MWLQQMACADFAQAWAAPASLDGTGWPVAALNFLSRHPAAANLPSVPCSLRWCLPAGILVATPRSASRQTHVGSLLATSHALNLCPPAGNLVGLALSPFLLARLGWRGLFVIFGAVGFPLLALWLAVVPKPAGLSQLSQLPQPSPKPGQEQVRRQMNAEPQPRDTPQPLPKQAAPLPADPSHALPKQRLPTPGLDATSLVGAVQQPSCSRRIHSLMSQIAAPSTVHPCSGQVHMHPPATLQQKCAVVCLLESHTSATSLVDCCSQLDGG